MEITIVDRNSIMLHFQPLGEFGALVPGLSGHDRSDRRSAQHDSGARSMRRWSIDAQSIAAAAW